MSGEDEERKDEFLKAGPMGQSFLIFVEGAGKTCVFVINTDMTLEDLEHLIQDVMCLPKLDEFSGARRLGPCQFSVARRHDACSQRFAWSMDVRLLWSWATCSTCYRCGEARGHTEDLQRHYPNVAREAREKGTSNSSVPVASSSSSPPRAAKAPPPCSVPPRVSSTAPWAPSKPLSEVDKIHDSDQTALLRAALALFENCHFPPGVLDEIWKIVPPHRPPTRKAPKVSREQIVLNMKKRLDKEEQELRERKSALEQARKLAAEKQQKVLDQATVVSDLKLQLVELRQDIANNPTPEASEDEEGDAIPLGVPLAPPPAIPPAFLPENTPLDPAGDDTDHDLLDEINPPATKRKGDFGPFRFL